MYTVINVIILVICVVLALVVLVQNSKGGGLASNFSSQNQYMGVRKTADFLEKTTWTLAIALVVLSLVAVATVPHASSVDEGVKTGITVNDIPGTPAAQPQNAVPAAEAAQQAPAQEVPAQETAE